MTVEAPQIAGATAAHDAAQDWQSLRDVDDIQYAPLPPIKPPHSPDWLKLLGEWLKKLFEPVGEALGVSWPVLEKLIVALGAVLVLMLLWRLAQPLLRRLRAPRTTAEVDWTPGRAAAEALLEDADQLAEQGRFGEAVHLLLQRSVSQIAQARPDWLHPASTGREIASLPMLPRAARSAFSEIAVRVERSLFALHDLDAADWQAARAAYADFALQDFDRAEPAP